MHIYRFRITFEDQDEFFRELEIMADQSFEDFHQALTKNLEIDPGMLSSFFICDHQYRKKKEISVLNMDPEPNEDGSDPVLIMQDTLLSDAIDDPHQKLLYVYDYLNYWTFYIELLKIAKVQDGISYPRFSKVRGLTPRELKATPQQIPGVEKGMDLGFDEDEIDPEDVEKLDGREDFGNSEEDFTQGPDEDDF